MTRRILLIEDDLAFLNELIEGRDYYGFAPDYELIPCANQQAVRTYLDPLIAEHTGTAKPVLDIALIDLCLNEKPLLAYKRVKKPETYEGIEIFSQYKDYIKETIFVTSRNHLQNAREAGFDFTQHNIQVCLKTNAYDAKDDDRFPRNLILAISRAYQSLNSSDTSKGETNAH